MADNEDFSSQSTNASISHDPHSQLVLEDEDLLSSGSESEENVDADNSTEVNWNLPFKDDAVEFEPNTHQDNSELGFTPQSTPLDILETLITEDMMREICDQSNLYADQKNIPRYKLIEVPELWRFFAVNFAMGIVKLPAITDYWKQKTLFKTIFFPDAMPRDRFIQILRAVHFVNNEEISATNRDRFVKLGSFMNELINNFKKLVHAGEYLCLDESMVPFKGRLSIKQYNPKKRTRFGIKLFILVDCATKIILDVIPYQSRHTKIDCVHLIKDLGFGGATVVSMLKPYFGKGHRVVVDNWFNSPKLARILKSKKTYVLGTVQKKRQGMPKNRRATQKLKKGEIEVFSDGDILVERWCDRRDVFMLNSFLGHSMHDSESTNPRNSRLKPGSVLLYNSKMGGVDEADKVLQPYKSTRKTYKWYRKVAFHLIDLAVYNSFLIYQQLQGKKLPYKDYLESLITTIITKHPKPAISRGRPSSFVRDEERLSGCHFPQEVVNSKEKPARQDCAYCWSVYKHRKMTSIRCVQCKKRLCVTSDEESCFTLYHTQTVLKKTGKRVGKVPIRSCPQPTQSPDDNTSIENLVSEQSESLLAEASQSLFNIFTQSQEFL